MIKNLNIALKGLIKGVYDLNWDTIYKIEVWTSDRSNQNWKSEAWSLAASWPMFGGSNTERGMMSRIEIGPLNLKKSVNLRIIFASLKWMNINSKSDL